MRNFLWDIWPAVVVVAAILGAIFVLIWGVNSLARYQDHRTCTAFGIASNREVKFVEYTMFSWDCLTPQGDKWISTDKLRDVD